MKEIKLISVFIAIVGVMVGVFFLLKDKKSDSPTIIEHDDTFKYYCDKIEKSWQQAGDWDAKLYNDNHILIKQIKTKYPSVNINTLHDLNTNLAIEVVDEKIFSEWHSVSCSKDKVRKYYNAIRTITQKDANFSSNSRVKKIQSVYSTYKNCEIFVHEQISLQPIFNGQTWNSYDLYAQEMSRRKEQILKNGNYKEHLSNIRSFKDSLSKIDDKIANGRKIFYDNLQLLIINYYSPIPANERTLELRNELRTHRNNFHAECTSHEYLNAFVDQFNIDVQKNISNDNEYIY